MVFDLHIITNFYKNISEKINIIQKTVNRPLTLSEKILYLHSHTKLSDFKRGRDYIDFNIYWIYIYN